MAQKRQLWTNLTNFKTLNKIGANEYSDIRKSINIIYQIKIKPFGHLFREKRFKEFEEMPQHS